MTPSNRYGDIATPPAVPKILPQVILESRSPLLVSVSGQAGKVFSCWFPHTQFLVNFYCGVFSPD